MRAVILWRLFEDISSKHPNPVHGDPEGIRTPDLLIRNQSLYPTELRDHKSRYNI